MLAQNFKTPAALGISDIEFEALLKVLGMLERDEIKHLQPAMDGSLKYFNMGWVDCQNSRVYRRMGAACIRWSCL